MDENLTKAVSDITALFAKLAGPLTDEVGLMFGDKAREYRIRNAVAISQRVKKMLADAHIEPQPIAPRLFLPALQAAVLEDNETLQEKWAALLTNASDPNHSRSVLPSFVEILKELTPEEALLMDKFFKEAVPPGFVRFPFRKTDSKKPHDRGAYLGTFIDLQRIAVVGLPVDQIVSNEQLMLMVDDLVRVGLLDRLPWYPSTAYPDRETVLSDMLGHNVGESQYFCTHFALAFMEACTVPNAASSTA
jgi:hypothetical protein